MADRPLSFRALALQTACHSVSGAAGRDEARALMHASLERIHAQVRASKAFLGPSLQLVVLPEYVLTGFPMGESFQTWIDHACLEPSGVEYDELGKIAGDNDVWLAGNAYEVDDHFPGLYFQTCFLIAPTGEVLTRYRRLNSMFAPTPHDVWDAYLDVYGIDGVFPVARTPIGNLATIASEEILYPEIARCFALRGAEVFLHPTSEAGSPIDTPKAIARRARAIENLAYVVSANTAGVHGIDLPVASADGGSCLVDPQGRVLAQAGAGESMVANAPLDLGALREMRQRPGMDNLLSRQRTEAVASTYASTSVYPANTLADGPPAGREHFIRTQQETIRRLIKNDIIDTAEGNPYG